jgi:hypothetical protein
MYFFLYTLLKIQVIYVLKGRQLTTGICLHWRGMIPAFLRQNRGHTREHTGKGKKTP